MPVGNPKVYSQNARFNDTITMPNPGDTTHSVPFDIPWTAFSMLLFVPTLAAAATWGIEVLQPQRDMEGATEVWWPGNVLNLSSGAFVALTGFTSNKAIAIPTTALAGSTVRIVASADQSGSPSTIIAQFSVGTS